MVIMEGTDKSSSVYGLLSKLCEATAQKYPHQSHISDKKLVSKMRSLAYEILLKKSSVRQSTSKADPFMDLLSCQFMIEQSVTNIMEYKRCADLKKSISSLRNMDMVNQDNMINVIKLLINLCNTQMPDLSTEIYQKPFSLGLLEKMLPRPKKESFGAEPYPVYPSYIFQLPFTLKIKENPNGRKKSYMDYSMETFESRSLLPAFSSQKSGEDGSYRSPMSLPSLTSTRVSPYSDCNITKLPRLVSQRDLQIPKLFTIEPKISLVSEEQSELSLYKQESENTDERNIWELALQIDKDINNDIWNYVSKLPEINERQLISTSSREKKLWRQTYSGCMKELNIVSERQFIRHITYLLIGVETRSFPFNKETNSFRLKQNLTLECISREHLEGYIAPLLIIGTYYRRLYDFAFIQTVTGQLHDKGFVYEATRETIRQYLLKFRLEVTEIFEEFCNSKSDLNCMPTLLQILFHCEPLKYEIQTVASIYKLDGLQPNTSIPHGAELMSYLFNEISLVTHKKTAQTLYNSLFIVCREYFKFIEKFIFEGELDDPFNEFFIRKDNQYVNSRSKRYWDKGFHITLSVAIPEFLRPLASYILLCGKSLRLLKLCNPTDPLVLLISSDHPSVRCCSNFDQLEREQQILDVYRTRCLFVSGEPVTFDQILLKKEAERKAFTEMASLKQAETMEKIIAERKRLAQLIIAEKQHSLRVLEAAMAEAKAAKNKSKQREKHRQKLEDDANKASEEVDSKLKDDEKNKMLEYYSKLNMEVEKSKIHTEWKIRRLQLDQTRIQLLSAEERNLKREKLELEHQRNEDIMAMSIQSDFKSEDGLDGDKNDGESDKMTASSTSLGENPTQSEHNVNRAKSQTSSDVFSAICNVAKSIFGVKSKESECDNEQELDSQGNVVKDSQNNKNEGTSSDVIGADVNQTYDNTRYLESREEAVRNRLKVMAHEFTTDYENNFQTPTITLTSVDEENNVEESPFTEARRNKMKVLGTEFGIAIERKKDISEPITEAQREAVLNKEKVLGVEFNKAPEIYEILEPRTEAQREALVNRQKVLGDDFGNTEEVEKNNTKNINPEWRTDAQKEALFNKNKVLGDDFGVQEVVTENIKDVNPEYRTEAQKEALINKQKVMGVEYNLPLERVAEKEPANIAQIEALRNKNNVMGSEHYDCKRFDSTKKSGLKLNLKPFGEPSTSSNTGAVTPGELFPRLDLETPTTAELPIDGQITSDIFTPRSDCNKDFEIKTEEKDYLGSKGFDFSLIVDDETAESEMISDQSSPDTSPIRKSNKINKNLKLKTSVFNILDGTYCLDEFDPFGVKKLEKYSKSYFVDQLTSDTFSCYPDPITLMQEMDKKPYKNIYKMVDENNEWIDCDNIATLTACLQRSVMLPLTYQLEVVNNSILTHFLVNLDMYEHLRSLKDYFFLMDGEFSRSICHNLFAKLSKTLNPQDLLNFSTLHNILDKALGSSISHVHKFSENLSFSIPDTPLSFQHSSPDVLQCLSLTYTVDWPLNIILSNEALNRYAKVFQFLIKMRRISWILSEDFETLKLSVKLAREHSRTLLRSPQYISIQLYRHIMASLIRALDNYIVTTCILTSWTEFEKDLRKAKTLDDLYECHVVYIKNVLFRCLLNNRSTPVMKLLNDIFTVILKFSRVLKAGEWQQKEPNGHFTHTNYVQLDELYHLYEKVAKYLLKVITKLMECGYQRHLVELLTMINLNGYFDPDKSQDTQCTT